VSDYWSLMRPRIVTLVLLAMAVSAWTTGESAPSWPVLAHALLGAAMVIAGAIALNQRLECYGDAKMPRTAGRPLPAHRLGRPQVTCFGLAATALGLAYLAVTTNPSLTVLAAIGWLAYVGVYTPLKPLTSWQTPVGAAAGAMPVLLGAAVVEAAFHPSALVLFGIVYFWQFPHAMAIAWRYRQEFAAAGVKVATVTDPSGRTAGVWAVLGTAALLPISLLPWFLSSAGATYGVAAVVLGAVYLGLATRFARCPNEANARRLRHVSLVYLPSMLAVLLLARI
jgi:heme o synthase